MHQMRLFVTTSAILSILSGCITNRAEAPLLPAAPQQSGGSAVTLRTCEHRDNDTLTKLEACIQRDSLWGHLAEFQKIADAHPGPHGHPDRDAGTPGYRASVAYVAGLMRAAGYTVTVQRYIIPHFEPEDVPTFAVPGARYAYDTDWFVARNSGDGDVTARVQPPSGASDGCAMRDFTAFARGTIALLARSDACDADTQAANASGAGAAAVVIYNPDPAADGVGHEARLLQVATIPVIGVVSNALGTDLLRRYRANASPMARIALHNARRTIVDYNLIADSPYGDVRHTIVLDAHLDSIYGAGMLDNASGSTTVLEIALAMAKTPTRNHLRYVWFGGEELGLFGSKHYVGALTKTELRDIAFDVDADVTATPNYDIYVAAVANAFHRQRFPPNVVPQSRSGNDDFLDYFRSGGVIARNGNSNGTDSLSFAYAGVPNTGILTEQDCCKHAWETALWGGSLGNYEGKIPSYNGGCVDYPRRWCDNLDNNDPFVLELASKAVAYVAFELAYRRHFPAR